MLPYKQGQVINIEIKMDYTKEKDQMLVNEDGSKIYVVLCSMSSFVEFVKKITLAFKELLEEEKKKKEIKNAVLLLYNSGLTKQRIVEEYEQLLKEKNSI